MQEMLSLVVMAVMLSATIVVCGFRMITCLRESVRRQRTDAPQRASTWNGTVFESKTVVDRVRHLREDYLAALTERPDDALQRKKRLAATRRAVGVRSYFLHLHTDGPEQEPQLKVY